MKYVYKTVSIDEFVNGGAEMSSLTRASMTSTKPKLPKTGIKALTALAGDELSFGKNISEILDRILNFYGIDGWEYWQTIELGAHAMQTLGGKAITGLVGNITGGAFNPNSRKYPIVIFRKAMTDEEYIKYEEVMALEEKQKEELEKTKQEEKSQSYSKPYIPIESQMNDEAEALGIIFDGEKYCFKEFKYDKVQDAIAYARKNAS